jgi:Transposase, Mutator family
MRAWLADSSSFVKFSSMLTKSHDAASDALTYLGYPGSHHARLRTTNMLERLFREGDKEEDEGGRRLPHRDERGEPGDGGSSEKQRGVGAKVLPAYGRP